MFMHADIHKEGRYTVLNDMGSLGIVLLRMILGHTVFHKLVASDRQQLRTATGHENIKRASKKYAATATRRMDQFAKALIFLDNDEPNDEVITDLVRRVPEYMRQYLSLVQRKRSEAAGTLIGSACRKLTQAEIASGVDYKKFSAVFQ